MQRLAWCALACAVVVACDDDVTITTNDAEVTPDGAAPDAAPDGAIPDAAPDGPPLDAASDMAQLPPDAEPDPDMAPPPPDGALPDGPAEPLCGNGEIDGDETCDDGNLDPGDGCDASCERELQVHAEPDGPDDPLELVFHRDRVASARFVLDGVDEDWFAFNTADATDLVIETHAPGDRLGCDGDTELTLFDADRDALATNDNGGFSLCSVLEPVGDAAVRDIPAGRYLIRVTPRTDGPLVNLLVVRQAPRIPADDDCHARGLLGRCADGLRCGRVDAETFVGTCVAPGCTDGAPDPDEACDDGNDVDDDLCTNACALNGPTEVEPNESADTASAMGATVAPALGERQLNSSFGAVDDVDTLAFSIPDGPATEIGFFTRDGFLGCPGVVRARLWAAGAPDAPLAIAEVACGVTFAGPLDPGDYLLQLSTDDPDLVGVPLVSFAASTTIAAVGEACGTPGVRCDGDTFCGDDDLCVAHACGDHRVGPGEECDDGNEEGGDGCSDACIREAERVDGGGQFPGALAAGEVDLYAFSVDEPSFVELETSDGQQRCPGDTELRLQRRTPDGWEVFERNDDGAANAPCSALGAYVGPGDWRIEVLHHFGEALDDYVLSVLFRPVSGDGDPCGGDAVCAQGLVCARMPATCAPPACGDGLRARDEQCDDGNQDDGDGCSADCLSEAVDVNRGGDFPGHTEAGEIDFYAFDLAEGRTVRAEVSDGAGGCPADTFMNLERRDERGGWVRIASDDDGGIEACSRIEAELEAGAYRLAVFGLGGLAVGDYVLNIDLVGVAGEGGVCDRAGIAVVCAPGLFCLMTDVDGQGLCGELLPTVDEAEPNDTVEMATPAAPDVAVRASLSVGDLDLYVVNLAAPATLAVETGDGRGGCPGDTVLYRLGGAGIDDLDNAAASNDDVADGVRCSRLVEALDAGDHVYLVEDFRRNDPLDYTAWFRVVFPLGEGGRCDPAGIQNSCRRGLDCADADGDGDGRCE